MNCLYITLFLKIFAGIVQTFIKSWNQLLYPRVIEVCRQPFEPRHDFLHFIIVVEIFPSLLGFRSVVKNPMFHLHTQWNPETHLLPLRSPFAFRNRMTERTSHLAGLCIGAAISNTPHSNKADSTAVKRARLTGKGSRSTAVLP